VTFDEDRYLLKEEKNDRGLTLVLFDEEKRKEAARWKKVTRWWYVEGDQSLIVREDE